MKTEKLLVFIGPACNNNCIFCSVSDRRKNELDRSTEDIKKEILLGKEKGFKKIEFIGGEPTIRRDICELVFFAKNNGFEKISITTNGRMLSYEKFCNDLIKSGLNAICFSLNATNNEINKKINKSEVALKQTLKGMDNLKKFEKVHLSVNTIVQKLNYKSLNEISKLISSFGIKEWYIANLVPDGAAKHNYLDILVRLKEIKPIINNLLKDIEDFESINVFDFPLCIFNKEIFSNKKINIYSLNYSSVVTQIGGQSKKRLTYKTGKQTIRDIYKIKTEKCMECILKEKCGGLWKDYFKLWGDEELIPFSESFL
ncbi:hypothetical protein CL621_01370 [archaeon]|nr:hypothetical protein [archaeon]